MNADQNGNAGIDYSEFLSAVVKPEQMLADRTLKTAFERLDVSNTGRITMADLTDVLGAHYDDHDLKKLMEAADTNHDGSLDFDEFKTLMKSAALGY